MIINSKTTFTRGGQVSEAISNEHWTLVDQGQSIEIKLYSSSVWRGERKIIAVYDKN